MYKVVSLLSVLLVIFPAYSAYDNELVAQYQDVNPENESMATYGLRFRHHELEVSAAVGSVTSVVAGTNFYFWEEESTFVPYLFLGGGYYLGLAGAAGLGGKLRLGPLALRLDNYLFLVADPKGVVAHNQLLTLGVSLSW